jgi:CheY-like chemotaxis protein
MSRAAGPVGAGSGGGSTTLLDALVRVANAPTLEAAADLACEAVVAQGRWGRVAFVFALPTGVVTGFAGVPQDERESLRADGSRYGPVERATNRQRALEGYRLAAGLDAAFIPQERRGALWESHLRGPTGAGSAGERWEQDDELVLLPHCATGSSLGTLALSAPADGLRPTAASAERLREPLAFAGAVGALLRARAGAAESGREQSRRVLDHVQSLTGLSDVGVLLDRVAEICARLAGYRVGVLTAHMEDGPRVGAFNLAAEERARFIESSSRSTAESTAGKRARIRSMAFPGTGIAYVPRSVDLSRSKAFVPGKPLPGGTWHPEDRLFLLLKTTQGRDIGVLSLDEPLDGRAPAVGALGALEVAQRFLDLAGALLETRLLQSQVERTQRLEAVGSLVTGVAHDFNNLLGAIMGYASLLRVQLPEGSELLPTARALEEACERAAGTTRRLRALTQSPPVERRPVDPTQLLADVARTVRDTFDPRHPVETDVSGGLPTILGDPGQLSRTLLNLCLNAPTRCPTAGRSCCAPGPRRAPTGRRRMASSSRSRTGARASRRRRASISSSPSSPPSRAGRERAWVCAAPGARRAVPAGASRPWTVPASRGRSSACACPPPGPLGSGRGGALPAAPAGARVLLVEDEHAIQDLVRRGIELLGHRVEAVADGQTAIDLLERRAGDFDLVLLDLLLPRRNGVEVFRVLRGLRADLPVILSSGNVEEALLDDDMRAGVAATLPKPWTLPQLQDVVQRVLASAPRAPRA